MADDLKTMSGFVMGLLDRMDEDDVKYKGLIPGTNIPSVMSQFQDIPQGPQMVPDSRQLFRSQMTVPELEQFKVPEKSTPPIVPVPEKPYEGSEQYMQNYFSQNQSRLPDRDPVPPTVYTLDEGMPIPAYSADVPKTQLSMEVPTFQGPVPEPYQDAGEYMRNYFSRNQRNLEDAREESRLRKERKSMLRSDGTMKDQTGFLGPIPTDDGRVMTEQTIGVEIDGKEVNIPALVPGLDEYEIGLLASGTVDWNSIVGKGMKEKAVNHYKFRKSKGLDPYYKEGEVAPPYYLANTSTEVPKGILPEFGTFRDPSEYIPEPQEPEVKQKEPHYIIPTWLRNPSEAFAAANADNTIEKIDRSISRLEEARDSGRQDPRSVQKQIDELKTLRERAVASKPRYADIVLENNTGKVRKLVEAGLIDQAKELAKNTGVDFSQFETTTQTAPPPPAPLAGLGGEGYVPPKPAEPVSAEAIAQADEANEKARQAEKEKEVVTSEEIEKSGSKIPPTVKEQVDKSIDNSNITNGNQVVTKTDPNTGQQKKVVVNKNGDEDPGFFKSLWNGIKSIAKEGFEDPALRRALFAYTASRVLGYDGVTLATGVLENEWKKQAAQAKADADLRKTMTKEQYEAYQKALEDSKPDYSKSANIYNPDTRTNTKGYYNDAGQVILSEPFIVVDSNGEEQKIPANTPLSIAALQSAGYSVGKEPGATLGDLQEKFLEKSMDLVEDVKKNIISELNVSDMEGTEKENLVAMMNSSTTSDLLAEPLLVFLDTLPRAIDPNDPQVRVAAQRGIREWLRAIKDGRATNNKDLPAFLELQKLTLDIKQRGIPQSFFKFEDNDKELGLNAFSKIRNSVLNHPAIRDDLKITSYPEILQKLAVIYGEDVVNKPKFESDYKSQSEDSLDRGKSEYITPFFAFVEEAFSRDGKDDLPALLERLKNIK